MAIPVDASGGEFFGSSQYDRKVTLLVAGFGEEQALDLSDLRIKFSVKRSDTITPNAADIRVYNVAPEWAQRLKQRLQPTLGQPNRGYVILQAGYQGNCGVIFQGNIYQIIVGRENATDTFVDIIAGDGQTAYNYAVVNTTIAAGAKQSDQINAVATQMAKHDVTLGHVGDLPETQLPRGKVMYGDAKNYLIDSAATSDKSVSIQDGKITFVPLKSFLPGERVVLTSKSGMIGAPNQTTQGVNVKCLINPMIKVGGLVQLDNASIQDLKIDLGSQNSAANTPAPLSSDGSYYVLAIEYQGDSRGVDWYSTLVCALQNVTSNPNNSV